MTEEEYLRSEKKPEASLDKLLGLVKSGQNDKNNSRPIYNFKWDRRDRWVINAMDIFTGANFKFTALQASELIHLLMPEFKDSESIRKVWYKQGRPIKSPSSFHLKHPEVKTSYLNIIDELLKLVVESHISQRLLELRLEILEYDENSLRESENNYFEKIRGPGGN